MSKFSIVPYASNDFDAVTALWFDSARTMGIPMPVTLADLRERWPKELAAGWIVYIAREGKKVVGFIALQTGEIAQLFIAPEYQGQGIGKMLLDLAKSHMPEGFTLTTAVASRASNFYEREGLIRGEIAVHRFGHEIVRYDWRPLQP